MEPKRAPKSWNWEGMEKILSAILVMVTIVFGIVQYKGQNERQYRQRVYEEQFKLYSEILDLSARLAGIICLF